MIRAQAHPPAGGRRRQAAGHRRLTAPIPPLSQFVPGFKTRRELFRHLRAQGRADRGHARRWTRSGQTRSPSRKSLKKYASSRGALFGRSPAKTAQKAAMPAIQALRLAHAAPARPRFRRTPSASPSRERRTARGVHRTKVLAPGRFHRRAGLGRLRPGGADRCLAHGPAWRPGRDAVHGAGPRARHSRWRAGAVLACCWRCALRGRAGYRLG